MKELIGCRAHFLREKKTDPGCFAICLSCGFVHAAPPYEAGTTCRFLSAVVRVHHDFLQVKLHCTDS